MWYKGNYKDMLKRNLELTIKVSLVRIVGLQLANMKLESLVIVNKYVTVNFTSILYSPPVKPIKFTISKGHILE